MQHDSFVRARQAGWQRLEQLLRELDRRGWRSLQPAQLEELSSLYLQASSDLALAATHFPQGQTHRYLNSLVARSHARLYGVRTTSWCDILHFFWHQVPETFWRLRRAVLAASLLFVLGALAGAATATWQPDYAAALLPQQFRDVVAQGDVPEPGQHGMPLAEAPVLSTVIMLNNIQVAALSFALGVTAGLGTVYVLLQNGALLGVLAAVFQHQWALRFWSLILPHGLLELTAIFIAGGAGLHFAVGLIRPGDLPRSQSMARHGREAVTLVVAAVPMLVLAGLVEGFVTPADVPAEVKFLVAALSLVPMVVYLWPRRSYSRARALISRY
ncbi:MAG: stage II sporulation protein M [Bacillota bacterium]